ncbi:sensor histidine kinase [Pedosphaera parvula]|uniref:Histidine kinase n=1 Tax=Pedosphaera parvula (strain Ellin514) TaxID=320771 RepID=B9XHL4_PEDPL|nr:sensor histidine kinase [Pedosphaera parvula]EEF60592.1 histidine kinase [Pedosphaera parvula Ellin514]
MRAIYNALRLFNREPERPLEFDSSSIAALRFGRTCAFGFGLVWLLATSVTQATTLWSNPEATLIYNSGSGSDILKGALKRDDTARDTLYFKFHIAPLSDSKTEEYFAAFELFETDTERLAVGNALAAYAYSAFFKTGDAETTAPASSYLDLHSSSHDDVVTGQSPHYEFPRRGVERTIIFKVQYVAGGDDLVTVWLNPDLSVGATEVHQPESLTTRFNANASFDEIRLRHGGAGEGWVFSDLAIATSFSDFVDPSSAMPIEDELNFFFNSQRFVVETWLREPGMPRTDLRALAQTADGYLWLASDDRVVRFDGVRFVPFETRAATGGGIVQTLFGDSQGALWIGTTDRGLTRYANGEFETFTVQQGLPSANVTAIAEGDNGEIFVGTSSGLAVWRSSQPHSIAGAGDMQGKAVKSLFRDREGTLWIAVWNAGIFRYRNGAVSQWPEGTSDETLQNPQSVVTDGKGRVWIAASGDAVLCHDKGHWRRYRIPRNSQSPHVRILTSDAEGSVWAGSTSEGLYQFREDTLTPVNASAGFPVNEVSAMLVDHSGNLWIAGGSGLHLLKRKQTFQLGQAEGLGKGPVASVAEVAPGLIWAIQPEHGLLGWEGGSFRRLSVAGLGPEDSNFRAMLVTRDKACWLACGKGLLLIRDPQAVADESQLFQLPGVNITALAEGNDGSIWAGTREGQILRLDQGRLRIHAQSGSKSPVVAMAAEADGQIWVGTDGGGLYLVGETGLVNFSDRLLRTSIQALHRDAKGTLWVAMVEGGLAAVANKQVSVYPLPSGLSDNKIYGLLEDRAGRLWLSHRGGVTCAEKPSSPSDGLAVLGSFPFGNGSTENLLQSPGSNTIYPKGCSSSSGCLWFGNYNGITVVDPLECAVATNGLVLLLEEVMVDGLPAAGFKPIAASSRSAKSRKSPAFHVGPGHHHLELRYSSPHFENPEQLRFRYQMKGLDQQWTEAGSSRIAQYNYVPAGDYQFIVSVDGANGRHAETAVDFSVSPYFWQHWWVLSLASVGLLASVIGGARYLEHQKMKRHMKLLEEENALERERTRIARDLHDEIGAKLCRISFLSAHAARLDNDNDELKEQIWAIEHDSRDLLHSLDEIVWVVNPQNDTLEHVASYIAQYTQNYFQGTGLNCELEIPKELPHFPVSSQTRHHLFLAVHEALTNVLKHSGANRVKVTIACSDAVLRIQVRDEGKGFGETTRASQTRESADGLQNMRQRLEAIGGQCRIQSTPEHGTAVEFKLPLNREAKEKVK